MTNKSKQLLILGTRTYGLSQTTFQGVYILEGFSLISGLCLCIFKILQQERFHWGFEPRKPPQNTPMNVCFLAVG